MARPQKKTVDYFPHRTVHGKTMFVLESRWGNDGYAFWFRLLEILGSSDGLFYDCNNPPDWQFLLARTKVEDLIAVEILNCLADMEAIDRKFWDKKVIYSQNFVDGVADAFKRRLELLPDRNEVNAYINLGGAGFRGTETGKGKGKGKGKESKPLENGFDWEDNFVIAWAAYPVKKGTSKAQEYYHKIVRCVEQHNRLMSVMNWYINDCKTSDTKMKHGSTFFNQWEAIEVDSKQNQYSSTPQFAGAI